MTSRELELSDAPRAACTASLERRNPQIAIRRTLATWRHTRRRSAAGLPCSRWRQGPVYAAVESR